MTTAKTLSEKAMLVRQCISFWSGRKYDRKISDEIADSRGAEHDAGRYNKMLISKEATKEIRSIRGAAKAHHYESTLPWENGVQLLPAAGYLKYMETQQDFRVQYDAAVADFCRNYPGYVDEARVTLNGMFNENDYPPQWELTERFGIQLTVMPMPDSNDFRVSLSDSETEKIRAGIEDAVQDRLHDAMQDLWQRVYSTVEHMRNVLADQDKRITESMTNNLREIVDLLPVLNVTGDPNLKRLADDISASLFSNSTDTLRHDSKVRAEQAKSADDILATMAGYIGGGK